MRTDTKTGSRLCITSPANAWNVIGSAIRAVDSNQQGSPSDVSVEDFNKNNLLRYAELYTKTAPSIIIEYNIRHRICENDTTDKSIIRLLPFLGIKEFEENRTEKDGIVKYNIGPNKGYLFFRC